MWSLPFRFPLWQTYRQMSARWNIVTISRPATRMHFTDCRQQRWSQKRQLSTQFIAVIFCSYLQLLVKILNDILAWNHIHTWIQPLFTNIRKWTLIKCLSVCLVTTPPYVAVTVLRAIIMSTIWRYPSLFFMITDCSNWYSSLNNQRFYNKAGYRWTNLPSAVPSGRAV